MSTGPGSSRPHAPRRRSLLAAVAVLALLTPAVAAVPASSAPVRPVAVVAPAAVPATPPFGPVVDAPPDYQGQTLCTPVAKVGTAKLAALLRTTYGAYSIGIARSCSQGGQSEHKEGRALDWMVSYKGAATRVKAQAFLSWLLAPDASGNQAAMARRLGVMYIGWNNRFWAGYDIASGWTDLKGCSTTPAMAASSYDTYCHRNHVHISLSWDGASALTSFWTGVPLAGSCQAPWSSSGSPAGPGTDLVPVTPVRVLDTKRGSGLAAPCRLAGPERWNPAHHDVVVQVAGTGEVPAGGVSAVAVRVTAYRTSAPTPTVSARATATSAYVPVVTSLSGTSYSSTTVVPVAADGTIRLAVDRGSADLLVDLVGWVPLLVPPTPTPALATSSGTTHLTRTTLVYDGSAVPLAPHETRTVPLAGVGPVPASGLTGLALTLATDASPTVDFVGVLTPSLRTYVGSVRSSTAGVRTSALVTPTANGDVVLRNTGASPVVVHLYLHAWFSDVAAADGGATMRMLAAPVRAVDSLKGLGLAGAVTTSTSRIVPLTGTGRAPLGARGALLSVSALGGTTDGILVIGSSSAVSAVSLVRGQWAHEVVWLPLTSTGMLAVKTASIGAQVRISILGYVA